MILEPQPPLGRTADELESQSRREECEFDVAGVRARAPDAEEQSYQRKLIEQDRGWFSALFNAAQDAVLIADDDRRYVDANPAACELFGLPAEDLKGRLIEEFVEEVQGAGVGPAWAQFRRAGIQRGECRLRRADGTFLVVEYNAKAAFAPGLHLSILRDVTQRKQAEKALAQQSVELAGRIQTCKSLRPPRVTISRSLSEPSQSFRR